MPAAHDPSGSVDGGGALTANVIVTVERQFDYPRERVFRAWTEPTELAQWRGSPGWHVETESLRGEQKLGGHHYHLKVRDNDPSTRVGTDGVYTEYFDPDVPLELRVEFSKTGRDGTLLRIIQGPYEPDVAGWHGEGWEKELTRLQDFLVKTSRQEATS